MSDFRICLVAAAACAAIGGCATTPIPIPPYAQMSAQCDSREASPVPATSLFFVSMRLPDCESPNATLTNIRTDKVRYGWAAPLQNGEFPLSLADHKRWLSALREDLDEAKSERIIIYIHGYNNSTKQALARAAAIRLAAQHDGPVIAMIWPSQSAILKYLWDETNADWTTTYMRGLLWEAAMLSDDIVLVAHSMGNRLALDAVRDLVRVQPHFAPKVKHLILSSPDVDRGALQRDLRELERYAIPSTIYASLDDEPLHLSWRLHGYPRAGDLNEKRRQRPFSWKQKPFYFPIVNAHAKLVDTTPVSTGVLGHADFIESEEGAADLCRVLNKSNPELGRDEISTPEARAWLLRDNPELDDDCARRAPAAVRLAEGKP